MHPQPSGPAYTAPAAHTRAARAWLLPNDVLCVELNPSAGLVALIVPAHDPTDPDRFAVTVHNGHPHDRADALQLLPEPATRPVIGDLRRALAVLDLQTQMVRRYHDGGGAPAMATIVALLHVAEQLLMPWVDGGGQVRPPAGAAGGPSDLDSDVHASMPYGAAVQHRITLAQVAADVHAHEPRPRRRPTGPTGAHSAPEPAPAGSARP